MEIRDNILPVLSPSGGKEEVEAIRDVIESGWWGKGPKVEEFEIYCLIWFSFMERAHDLFLAILFMRGRESQYSVYAG